jgi:hypothetical protein
MWTILFKCGQYCPHFLGIGMNIRVYPENVNSVSMNIRVYPENVNSVSMNIRVYPENVDNFI